MLIYSINRPRHIGDIFAPAERQIGVLPRQKFALVPPDRRHGRDKHARLWHASSSRCSASASFAARHRQRAARMEPRDARLQHEAAAPPDGDCEDGMKRREMRFAALARAFGRRPQAGRVHGTTRDMIQQGAQRSIQAHPYRKMRSLPSTSLPEPPTGC